MQNPNETIELSDSLSDNNNSKSPYIHVLNLTIDDISSASSMNYEDPAVMMRGPSCKKLDSKGRRYLFGLVHLKTAMIFILLLGSAIILALITFLFMKMPKALFLLLIPTLVVVSSTAAMLSRIKHFMYPLIAISMFHVVLSSYLMMVFLFYFFFKPLYIIMVLNWLWDTQHGTKTTSFYVQCGILFVLLVLFIAFNVWQAIVSIDYRKHLKRENSGMVFPIRR